RAARHEDALSGQSHAGESSRLKCFRALSRGFTTGSYRRRMRLAAAVAVLAAMLALAGSGGAGVPAPPTPGDVMPTWSPDGSVIVFLSTRDGSALRVVNPDGTGERQIPWLAFDATFSFSPGLAH